jgi:hypothetical protein
MGGIEAQKMIPPPHFSVAIRSFLFQPKYLRVMRSTTALAPLLPSTPTLYRPLFSRSRRIIPLHVIKMGSNLAQLFACFSGRRDDYVREHPIQEKSPKQNHSNPMQRVEK